MMKRNLIVIIGMLAGTYLPIASNAQETSLAADQNPRYAESLAKYAQGETDSLTATQGTTVQDIYKAYDWYEAKIERRRLRRERNYQIGFYGGYNNYGYGNSWNYQPYGYQNFLFPSIGFRSRHWRFGY